MELGFSHSSVFMITLVFPAVEFNDVLQIALSTLKILTREVPILLNFAMLCEHYTDMRRKKNQLMHVEMCAIDFSCVCTGFQSLPVSPRAHRTSSGVVGSHYLLFRWQQCIWLDNRSRMHLWSLLPFTDKRFCFLARSHLHLTCSVLFNLLVDKPHVATMVEVGGVPALMKILGLSAIIAVFFLFCFFFIGVRDKQLDKQN